VPGTEIGEPTPTQICELLIDVAMQSLFGKMQEIHAQQVESMQRIEHLAQEIEQIQAHSQGSNSDIRFHRSVYLSLASCKKLQVQNEERVREWRRKQDAVHQARDLAMHAEIMPVAELGCMICDLSNRVQS